MSKPNWIDFSDDTIKKYNYIQTGYDYDLKINNIDISKKKYSNKNILVSKKYDINSFFQYITLTTDEFIPDGTSIEYYISLKDKPILEDWIPILPNEKIKVENERLIFNDYGEAILRFDINHNVDLNSIKILKNNTFVDFESYTDYDGKIHILPAGYNEFDIWTASYNCNKNSIVIDPSLFNIKDIEEVFHGTDDKGKISLKYPYYTYNDIFENTNNSSFNIQEENLKLIIKSDSGITGPISNLNSNEELKYLITELTEDGHKARYSSGEEEFKAGIALKRVELNNREQFKFNAYNPHIANDDTILYPYFEFCQDKEDIYFSEYFNKQSEHGEGDIIAKYKYVSVPIRLKIILRNNTKNSTSSPIVNSYKINIY